MKLDNDELKKLEHLLERAISGALKSSIKDHGKLDGDCLSSTINRIKGGVLSLLTSTGPLPELGTAIDISRLHREKELLLERAQRAEKAHKALARRLGLIKD